MEVHMKKGLIIVAALMFITIALYGDLYDDLYGTSSSSSLYNSNSNSTSNLYSSPSYGSSLYKNSYNSSLDNSSSLYNNSNTLKTSNKRPYTDAWGNHYKHQENLWKDTDKDGVINYYDYNDRNSKVQTKTQAKYNKLYGW
jgi:hypothetical protein